jgi:hypothetical protein
VTSPISVQCAADVLRDKAKERERIAHGLLERLESAPVTVLRCRALIASSAGSI